MVSSNHMIINFSVLLFIYSFSFCTFPSIMCCGVIAQIDFWEHFSGLSCTANVKPNVFYHPEIRTSACVISARAGQGRAIHLASDLEMFIISVFEPSV